LNFFFLAILIVFFTLKKQTAGNRQQATGNRQQATGNMATFFANKQQAIGTMVNFFGIHCQVLTMTAVVVGLMGYWVCATSLSNELVVCVCIVTSILTSVCCVTFYLYQQLQEQSQMLTKHNALLESKTDEHNKLKQHYQDMTNYIMGLLDEQVLKTDVTISNTSTLHKQIGELFGHVEDFKIQFENQNEVVDYLLNNDLQNTAGELQKSEYVYVN